MRFCAAPIVRLKRSLRHSYKFSRLKKRVRLAFGITLCQECSPGNEPQKCTRNSSIFPRPFFLFEPGGGFNPPSEEEPVGHLGKGVLFYNFRFLASQRPSMLVSGLSSIGPVSH